jgi:eukaryotic-like serine/threonine-protein kinase
MTAEGWKRVKTIAAEAWARPADTRTAYIAAACGNDEALCREVSSLVASMAAAEDRFEEPPPLPDGAIASLRSLAGRRVGAYEILARVGAGGMGEVYKARDTRLDRAVAIKVLPPSAGGDPVSRERMTREARAVAALNHPHICTLYDIGSQDDLEFFVMEYVDGETLASRLSRGALPIAEAVHYAEQIASALREAHRAGIIHRDVKPANIMLSQSRRHSAGAARHAKLLDFGVSKAGPTGAVSDPTSGEMHVPLDLTLAGFVPGTAHYMAPEQFDRNVTDVRTDIFALGAVLFEMLAGRKAFEGNDRTEVLAAIRGKPVVRVSSLRSGVPAALDRLILKCLAKDVVDRYQTMDDLLADLRVVRRRMGSSRQARTLALGAALVTLAIGGTAAWLTWRGREAGPEVPPAVSRLAASAGVISAPALSPDGSTIVFSWLGEGVNNPELVLLRIGSTTRVQLTNDPGVEDWPTWSPDGSRIAFIRRGSGQCGIYTMPAAGGTERKLRDLRDDRYYGLAWSPDGRSIAYADRKSSAEPFTVSLLSLDTLTARRLTNPPAGAGDLRFAFSPDGRALAVIRLEHDIGVYVLATDTGTGKALLTGQQEWFGAVTWSGDGRHLILSANQQGVRRLWKLPIAGGGLEQLAIAGEDAYFPAVSARGRRLIFVREFSDWDFSRVAASLAPARAPAPFPSSPRIDLDPAFSPDGRKLAFVSERGGTREVWVSDADGAGARQLTSLRATAVGKPSWSPDGRYLAFHWSGINLIPAGGGASRRLFEDGELPTWSVDGRWIYFIRNRGGRFRIWKVPAAGGAAVEAIPTEASAAREGPLGVDLYFAKVGGGIWRRPVAGGEETLVVPDFNWALPGYWTVFSDGIYYLTREALADNTFVNHFRFFEFARGRTIEVGTLAGNIDDWIGGLTVSSDRRTVLYTQRIYQSREVMLVEPFR